MTDKTNWIKCTIQKNTEWIEYKVQKYKSKKIKNKIQARHFRVNTNNRKPRSADNIYIFFLLSLMKMPNFKNEKHLLKI